MEQNVQTYDVHTQHANDIDLCLKFAGEASRVNANEVGWMPLQAYREATVQRRLVIVENNADKVGFLLWQRKAGELKIYQIWVRPDARLILHGRALIGHVEAIAARHGDYRLRAWVASDIAANFFWDAIGFQSVSWRYSPRRTSRRIHKLWTRRILTSAGKLHARQGVVLAQKPLFPNH